MKHAEDIQDNHDQTMYLPIFNGHNYLWTSPSGHTIHRSFLAYYLLLISAFIRLSQKIIVFRLLIKFNKEVTSMHFQQKTSSHFSNLRCLAVIVFVLISFALIGCSNGGNDSSDSSGDSQTANDKLNGNYHFYLFSNSWNQMDESTFDGAGGLDLSTVYDSGGDNTTFSGTYTVESDGTLSIEDTDLEGQISADGNLFVTTDADASDAEGEILLGLALKSASGMDDSNLTGTYTVCQIRSDSTGTMSSRMSFTFDGAGVVSGDILEDSDGATASLTGTYSVASDGELDLTVTGLSKDFTGHVSTDANSFAIIDTDDDGEILLMVGVKTASGMDLASFSGDYQLNLYNSGTSDSFTSRIDLSADGSGVLSSDIIAASDGDLADRPDMNYTVASDGALAITGTDNIGQISSDGEFFILVDADATVDGEVALLIGIKKS
jgi:cytoskeletal protein CcmA (bactofilin family)